MLRLRTIVVLILIIGVIYALASPEKKKRWHDRLREFGRALTLSIVIYWIYMLVRYLYQHR
jgi:ABC-type dipeptide/oligopeptide/nickel transport system permease component